MNHIEEAIKEKETQVAKLQREIEALNGYRVKYESLEPTEKAAKPRARRRTKAEMAALRDPDIAHGRVNGADELEA